MNPWRKHRRQKLRRQTGEPIQHLIRLSDFGITVTCGPMEAGGPWRDTLGLGWMMDVPLEIFHVPLLLQRDDETDAQYVDRAFGTEG